jgi:nitroreductase
MNIKELVELQEWRCSVKKFDAEKKISADQWEALEKTLILSPSSFGLQPWKFAVISNPEIRKSLLPLSWNQTQVTDASHMVVFLYLNKMDEAYVQRYVDSIIQIREQTPESVEAYKGVMLSFLKNLNGNGTYAEWARKQSYIALGNFMTSAAALGIDSCPMEGIDPAKYDEVLGLKGTDYSTLVVCVAGYRHVDDKYAKLKKVRFPASELIKRF